MATIYYRLHSKDQNKVTPVYCRISLNHAIRFEEKTGYFILTKDWSTTTKLPKQNSEENKNLNSKLSKLKTFLFDRINSIDQTKEEINKDWILECIQEFRGEKPKNESDLLINHIQRIIDTAHTRKNQKKGVGLSEGRIKIYKTFKNTIISSYEKHINKKIYIKNVNLKFVEEFKLWLFSQDYSVNYVGKNLSVLKAVCNDANKQGIETSSQLENIRRIYEDKSPEEIIYLSFEELQLIEDLEGLPSYLDNARNWLILGCYLGQRGGDLMRVSKDKIKDRQGRKLVELQQEKTGSIIMLPLHQKAYDILETRDIHPISLQKFNDYVKEVCRIAGIDTPTLGRKVNSETGKKVKGIYPKHELIGSHVCRRSFASNFYSKISTPLLINVTGHKSESMFLKYIGKTNLDNALALADIFNGSQQQQ